MTEKGSEPVSAKKRIFRSLMRWPAARWLCNVIVDLCTYVCNHVVGHIPVVALRHFFYRHVMRWKIGRQTYVHERLRLSGVPAPGAVSIGDNVIVGAGAAFVGAGWDKDGAISIGNNVAMAYDVALICGGHDLSTEGSFAPLYHSVVVEDHAVIFSRASVIMCRIGRGAVVLPGAVVTRDVAPFEIVGGVPARRVRMREPQKDPDYRLDWHWRFH